MTLVEITITLAILALAAGLAIPAIGNLTHADLRRSASLLALKVREAYDTAALSGVVYRMVLTPGDPQVRCEQTSEEVRLDGGQLVGLRQEWRRLAAQDGALGQDANMQAGIQALLGETTLSTGGGPEEGEGGEGGAGFAASEVTALRLPGAVRLLDVWTEGLQAPVAEGSAYLYFFPQGYTQAALVHLEDGDRRVMTVRVHPLTGQSDIVAGYVESPH